MLHSAQAKDENLEYVAQEVSRRALKYNQGRGLDYCSGHLINSHPPNSPKLLEMIKQSKNSL